MNKTVIIGDIHGRSQWKDIIAKEQPDKVIFLGDLVTTHENISNIQQVDNVKEIINYKLKNWDNTIMLMGNHDLQMCGYSWAEMSGWNFHLYQLLKEEHFKEFIEESAQIAYCENNIIYSHAGISEYWLKNVANLKTPEEVCNMEISDLLAYNYLTGYGWGYGNSISQSPIWIRPQALIKSLPAGYTQIVGHTPVAHITNKKSLPECSENVYLCDCMPNEYLVKQDNEFIIETL